MEKARAALATAERWLHRLGGWLRSPAIAAVCAYGAYVLATRLDEVYALQEWFGWRLLAVWAYVALLNHACVSAGATVLRALFGDPRRTGYRMRPLEHLVQSMAVGLVVFVLGIYLAGYVCAISPVFAVVWPVTLVLVGAAWGLQPLRDTMTRWWNERPELPLGMRLASGVAMVLGAAGIVFIGIEAISTSAINFDARWYHFPVAQEYARVGCIKPMPGDNHFAFPHLTSMVHAWSLSVPGLKPLATHWILALQVEVSIVLWRIVAVAAGIGWMLRQDRVHGLWVVFFLFPQVFIYDQNVGGSADHVLGFFAVPIVLALARVWERFEWRWGVLLGLVLGGHLLTKYQAVYVFAAVTILGFGRWGYLMLRRLPRLRRDDLPRARALGIGLAAIMGCTAVVTAPHFVKNAVFHGNPTYPYGTSVFKHGHPTPPKNFYEEKPRVGMFSLAPPPKGPKGKAEESPRREGLEKQLLIGRRLYDFWATTRNRTLTKRRPYLGVLFSLLLPCLLLVRGSRRIWLAAAVAVIAFFVWGNTAPNDRYLVSFLDLMIAVSAALMVRVWQAGWLGRAGLVPLVTLQLLWAGDAALVYGGKRLTAARNIPLRGLEGKPLEGRIQRQRNQMRVTAETPEDAVILSRNYKALLGLDRTIVSDVDVAGGYVAYSGLKDPRELYELLRARGITHMLYPVGKRAPNRWNGTVLFDALFRYTTDQKRIGPLALGTLPPQPPPPTAPYRVLVYGVRGYASGLYPVEQLDISNREPDRFFPKPTPETPFDADQAAEQLAQANAVVTCRSLPAKAQSALRTAHVKFERLDRCDLFLRREIPR